MTQPVPRGLSRQGLEVGFAADEAAKSELLLAAQLLRAQGRAEAAADRFAQAAAREERLFERCVDQGLREKAWVHGFSAAGSWAQAGNFHQAIARCNQLLEQSDLPERLRRRVNEYVSVLKGRRAQWYAELNLAVAEAGATAE